MELLIVSDSHGRGLHLREALARQVAAPDAVCFLGDGLSDLETFDVGRSLLWAVRGNCDFGVRFAEEPTERTVDVMGHRILLTHGHAYGVKGGTGLLLSHAVGLGADIILFGHTHTPTNVCIAAGERVGSAELSRPVYLFNPGSLGEGSFGTLHLTEKAVLLSHGNLGF